jgi:hypothetical protein
MIWVKGVFAVIIYYYYYYLALSFGQTAMSTTPVALSSWYPHGAGSSSHPPEKSRTSGML